MSTFRLAVVHADATIFHFKAICLVEGGGCVPNFCVVDETIASKASRFCVIYHVNLLDGAEALENVPDFAFGRANVQPENPENSRWLLQSSKKQFHIKRVDDFTIINDSPVLQRILNGVDAAVAAPAVIGFGVRCVLHSFAEATDCI